MAFTILLVALAGSLALYDATGDSFKQGERAAELQQGLRIALETIGTDLRMAGFNVNPDGDPSRPDEQIEAAYGTAIVIRTDFDGALEPALAGGAFESVSTGNDEVVAYVLAKPDGSSADTLIFEADLQNVPRDGEVETVSVGQVALVHDRMPHTLYRVTFSNDTSLWGTQDFAVRQVLAENIGWMRFRYYDALGALILPPPEFGVPDDDLGGSEIGAPQRRRIRRIEVELRGLALDSDPSWSDQADANPQTQRFHKFTLTSTILPRNLGLAGIKDVDVAAGF